MRLRAIDTTAWLVIVASAVVLPVSGLAALMLLAGGDGTASAGIVDTFAVVLAPPLAFVAAIGTLRRNRIAWLCLIALLLLASLHFAWAHATTSPETTQERRADGVLVTTMGIDPSTHLPWLAASVLLLVPLLTPGARALFRQPPRDPATAPGRAADVDARPHPAIAVAATPTRRTRSSGPGQGLPALYLVITLFVGTAAGSGWLLVDGLRSDETWFPGARPSQARIVARADDPVSYWLSLGLYGLVAGAAVSGTLWLVRNAPVTRER